jgi:hypothetical protein
MKETQGNASFDCILLRQRSSHSVGDDFNSRNNKNLLSKSRINLGKKDGHRKKENLNKSMRYQSLNNLQNSFAHDTTIVGYNRLDLSMHHHNINASFSSSTRNKGAPKQVSFENTN